MKIYNKGFYTAYKKGRQAFNDGKKERDCPYADLRGDYKNMITYSQAWRNYWLAGFRGEPVELMFKE
jgi:ribosome modulation factor